MPAPEIYIDTSVIGGYFDDEFKAETHRLWELEKKGLYRFVTSVVTIEEISAAPARVKQHFAGTFEADMILRGSEEADELAEFYMSRQIVPTKYFDDAQHLANLHRENAFNAANLLRGYREVRIVSPKSLIYGFEKDI